MKNSPFQVCNYTIQPGERITLALPTPEIYTCAPMHIPIHVIHGKKAGPCLIICSTIHGDEANGVAILQQLLNSRSIQSLQGTLIAIPVINIYGLISQTRRLPDKRDLEVSFPGFQSGSLAARLAYTLSHEILNKATHCINLRTGEPNISLLPQIHAHFEKEETIAMAKAFQAPVILHSVSEHDLLWQMDHELQVPAFNYYAGEAHRLDEFAIKTGVKGILRVMRKLGMIQEKGTHRKNIEPILVRKSSRICSPGSGICKLRKKLGANVNKGDSIASIIDPFGTAQKYEIHSPVDGVIIARSNIPMVNEGDEILEIAKTKEEEFSQMDQWRKVQEEDEET